MDMRTKRFQPENADDVTAFIAANCHVCLKNKSEAGCIILRRTRNYNPELGLYPVQWRWIDGRAFCTSFCNKPKQRDLRIKDKRQCQISL
jgi:hypothetical protein